MALFCLYCLDHADFGAERRAATRPQHLEWAKSLGSVLRMAGALKNDAGGMIGSLLLIEADTIADARAIHAQDPYVAAGVFGEVHIHETVWALGEGKPE